MAGSLCFDFFLLFLFYFFYLDSFIYYSYGSFQNGKNERNLFCLSCELICITGLCSISEREKMIWFFMILNTDTKWFYLHQTKNETIWDEKEKFEIHQEIDHNNYNKKTENKIDA